jgi:hypothetical protein
MFHWEKLGRVYSPYDFPHRPVWMHEFGLAPWAVVFDTYVRIYFGCRPPRDAKGQSVSYTGYVDVERNNLFKIIGLASSPVLALGETGAFDEFGTYPLSVVRRDNAELLGYYAGWTRCESVPFNVGIGVAISQNSGKTFEKLGPGPSLPYSPHEPFVLSGPKIRKFGDTYCLFYIAGQKWLPIEGRPEICHKIRLATSQDGLNWTKLDRNLIPNVWDDNESQASPDVIYANGRYHMFFCGWIPSTFRSTHARRIGYAWSNDMVNWTRDDTLAGIAPSESGWDSEMVAYPHVLALDGKTYMFYIGNEVGRFGFGLARLVGEL